MIFITSGPVVIKLVIIIQMHLDQIFVRQMRIYVSKEHLQCRLTPKI